MQLRLFQLVTSLLLIWCIAATPVITINPEAAGQPTFQDAVHQIVTDTDSGKDVGAYVMSTADYGVDAAIECSRYVDPAHPARNAALMEVIARAGQSRRSHGELLKLYDPAAYRLFYASEGNADQQLIGKGLALETWPPRLPEAMVRAAPLPTLEWLKQQAVAGRPRIPQLILIWQTWGFWARAGHERQYVNELGRVVGQLATNRAILADATASAALVRFAGEVRARGATPFVIDQLLHGPAPARMEAAAACARLVSGAIAEPLIEALKHEEDPGVQQKLAESAEEWPDKAHIGAAMLDLFNRTRSLAVRCEILFSCAGANWPSRTELLRRAFDVPGDGVLGAALSALSIKPDPASLERTLEVAKQTTDALPPLIDALAAFGDPRAVPHLIRWLNKQDNPVVRVKLLLALEKTSKHEADALLLQILNADSSPMVVEQTIGIIARKRIAGAESVLISLSLDATAPMQLRIAAIGAMGHFDTPEIRKTLEKIDGNAEQYFKSAVDPNVKLTDSETIDMARMMVAVAKIEQGDKDGDAKLQLSYDRGTAVARLTALVMLAQTGHDHPIISQGLATTDTAVLFGAVRAANAANPKQYHDTLFAIRHAPFIDALLNSGLDSANLRPTLDAAIQAGEK